MRSRARGVCVQLEISAILGKGAAGFLARWYPRFVRSLMDERYLVGRRLHNLSE